MKTLRLRQQAGYALILMVLGLMGVGGVVLAGFTQQAKKDVDQQRYQHNQRVLEEAKQALLMYAYNYPQIALAELGTIRGPGRLPCPDTNSSGTDNNSFNCVFAGDAMVGRFPWNADGMNFYEARDASGEHLWYAVSQNFARTIGGVDVVNSDSLGSITISDQTGALIYDADPGVGNGVAAVIIAPGPPIARDENDDGVYEYMQDRSIAANDSRNYLDTYNEFDNSEFLNDESDDDEDGFIFGPVYEDDPNSAAFNTVVVNDQMIVITTEEVIEVAEKAVFQAYRDALNEYQANIGVARYPWLDPYDSNDGLGTYNAQINPAPPAPIVGRLPTIFADYFAPSTNGSETFISEVTMKFTVDGEQFEGREFEPGASFDTFGNLDVPAINGGVYTAWAWDGSPSQVPTQPVDGIWESCPYVTGTEEDCNQDLMGNFIGGVTSPMWLSVRKYTVTLSPITQFPIADRTVTAIAYVPPTATRHAFIEAEFDGPAYAVNVSWEEDEEFQDGHDIFPVGNTGNLTYDAGDTVTVGVRYYPVLPEWVTDNYWHDMMQVAYSASMQPGGDGDCVLPVNDCLILQYPGAVTRERPGLLILSGSEGDFDIDDTALIDDTPGVAPYYEDELGDIFEGENADNPPDRIFDYQSANINDVVFPLE
ncbi:MAG: hypothetical protein OEU50_02965 [Gammaproteobacteria bacterium]|nr:hypothetical protein [Gammaproteobacteria bacterium]